MAIADNEKAVVVRDLERRFGSFVAVNRISFEVGKGEIFGFLGPNGAGKSTTIRILCGILAPSGGTGTVAGFDIVREAEKIKAHIGYMSQKFSLYEDLTVEENINFYGGIYNIAEEKKKERKEWVLRMAGLEERRSTRTSLLAGGWKQRLALGCAILHEPPIIFLDEPTSGVDPISRRRFWDLIYELSGKGVTIFVEWMREDVLECVCDRPQEARELIEHIPGLKEVALFGKGLHVVVENAETFQKIIRQSLIDNGYRVIGIEKIVPSLEDVFVSLIEARDRVEQAQAEVRK